MAPIVENGRTRAEVIELRAESVILDLSCNVAAGSEDKKSVEMPFNGWTSAAIIQWPSGCLNMVGVRIIVDGKQMIPQNTGWIALEDATIDVAMIRRVEKNRLIEAEFKNNDIDNAHWISVLVAVSSIFPIWARVL